MTLDDIDTLVTRTGYRFVLRPVTAHDEAGLSDFFRNVSPEDLRFRFLTSVREVSHDRLVAMISAKDAGFDSYLALNERREVVGTAILAGDAARERAEVAMTVRSDLKDRGIGWRLLEYFVGLADERGYSAIESIEDRQNHAAIELERQMGFTSHPVPGEPTLVLVRRTLR